MREIQADEALRTTLGDLSAFLDWMIGKPDDLTVAEYAEALQPVLGESWTDEDVAAHVDGVRQALAGLRAPEINADVLEPEAWAVFREETKGLRLLPARRTADAWLFQRLEERSPGRARPSGLEVAQALGSERAGRHRTSQGLKTKERAEWVEEATPEFLARLDGTHYGDTLRVAALLFDKTSPLHTGGGPAAGPKGTPRFPASLTKSGAWQDRLLATGLSSWTSLRHAWALHAKVTMFALGMTDDPAGVVEPAPRYYAALAALARSLVERGDAFGGFGKSPREVLADVLPLLMKVADQSMDMEDMQRFRGALQILEQHGDALQELCVSKGIDDSPQGMGKLTPRFQAWLDGTGTLDEEEQAWVDGLAASPTRANLVALADLLDELKRISIEELEGKAISEADAEFIRAYGKQIANLIFYGGNAWLDPQDQMGLVATIAVDPGTRRFVESAVGAAMELYVALPLRGGGHRLYQGGVYAWYEFVSERPSTDAEWLERVEGRRTPPLPRWTGSYIATADLDTVLKKLRALEIVEDLEFMSDPAIGQTLLDLLLNGKHTTSAEDAHLSWVAMALVPYGESDLRPRMQVALKNLVLHAATHVDTNRTVNVEASLGDAAAAAWSWMLDPEDIANLVGMVRRLPEGALPAARMRIVRMLEQNGDPSLGPAADALIQDADPAIRKAGLQLRQQLTYVGVGTAKELVDAVMAYLGRTTDDKERFQALLVLGVGFEKFEAHIGREHIAILAPLLTSSDPSVVGGAVKLWGYAVGQMPEGDPYLERARTWIVERFRGAPWAISQGCIEGLAGLGTEGALEALAEITTDPAVDVGLRRNAISLMARFGDAALPHLFRLAFDESVTGSSVNDHQLRICDEAAKVLNELLKLGLEASPSSPAEFDHVTQVVRDEAKKRGYAPR